VNGLQVHVAEELGTLDALLVPGGSWVEAMDCGVPREIRRGTLPRVIAEQSISVRSVAFGAECAAQPIPDVHP
jgi:hypothetical protein